MKKQIKRSTTGTTLMILLAMFALNLTSCKKKEERKPADFVVGDYIGSGISDNQSPFINQTIRVTKISKSRIKIEPVGHTHITTFEMDIEYVSDENAITGFEGTFSLAFNLEETPIEIGFGSDNGQTFGGEKQ
ncbi:MAG: hypothetical protein ACI865_000154 [Flavobacteriaceae bacterium]|jgi:hypothetical protein